MRKAAVRHPIAASLIVTFLFYISMVLGSILLAFSPKFFRTNGDFLAQFLVESVLCIFGALFAVMFGYGHVFNKTEKFGAGLICGGYFIVVSILSAISTLAYEIETRDHLEGHIEPAWRIAVFIATAFLIGLAEETFFRGIISNLFWDKHAKDPAGVWTATLYSGLIFGSMHIINMQGSDPSGVLVQMTAVTAMGMALTAIYYRTKNIWTVIFIHAFLDLCAMLSLGLFGGDISSDISSYSPMMAITSSVPYVIVTLVLLRKKKVIEMLAGEQTFGMFNPADGQLIVSIDMPSAPESKRSRNRAVVVTVVLALIMFAGCVLTSPDFNEQMNQMLGVYTLDYQDSGTSAGEDVVGKTVEFYVEEADDYKVTLIVKPASSAVDMLFQIKQGEDIIFEATYGGKCSDIFNLELDEGTYQIVTVYNFSRVEDDDCGYDITVRIE